MATNKWTGQLVINGLFEKRIEVRKPPRLTKQSLPGIARPVWDYPPVPPQQTPAYIMHEGNFERFVKRLEELAERAEKVFLRYLQREIVVNKSYLVGYRGTGSIRSYADCLAAGLNISSGLCNGVPMKADEINKINEATRKRNGEHARQKNELIKDYREFREEYSEMFSVVVQQHGGKEFFNPAFNPRSGNKKKGLFRRFINAYLRLHGKDAILIQPGPSPKELDVSLTEYKDTLNRMKQIVRDYKKKRDCTRNLEAAIKATKKLHTGLPYGSWKIITPHLKENRVYRPKELAIKLLAIKNACSESTIERKIYPPCR